MKLYEQPHVWVMMLTADKLLAGPVQSDPTVEDNEDDELSI